MGGISGCHHVRLAAAQVTRSRDWYRRAPGFEEQWSSSRARSTFFVVCPSDGTAQLEVRPGAAPVVALAGSDPIAHHVPAVIAVDAWRPGSTISASRPVDWERP
jgi:catechol 2,3-dioxygenase-like lactoylglutathione lyase family enzyme